MPGEAVGVAGAAGRGEVASTGGTHCCTGAGADQHREELGTGAACMGTDTGTSEQDTVATVYCYISHDHNQTLLKMHNMK